LQDASPASLFAPALIATSDRLPGAEACGKVSPRRAGSHNPEDALHDQAMLDRRTTCSCLLRQERTEVLPALGSQFLQGGQRDGQGLPLRRKRMLACSARHMAVLSDGLMEAPEA